VLDRDLHIAVLEGARAVSDQEGRAVDRQPIERLHDLGLGSGVHRAGGLVEDEQRRIPQERPGE